MIRHDCDGMDPDLLLCCDVAKEIFTRLRDCPIIQQCLSILRGKDEVFEMYHGYTPKRTREATPADEDSDDTGENGTASADGGNPKHTTHTGNPREANRPPTASDPRDPGDDRTKTPPPTPRAAAHERPMRRRRSGTGGRPPANQRTGTPDAAAADTAGKDDPDQKPAPDAPPTANTDTDARAARSDDNQSASAPAEQPTRNSTQRPETSEDANPEKTGDQTGDTTREPPTNSTDRNENTTHLPQTPPNKTNHDGQHAAAKVERPARAKRLKDR